MEVDDGDRVPRVFMELLLRPTHPNPSVLWEGEDPKNCGTQIRTGPETGVTPNLDSGRDGGSIVSCPTWKDPVSRTASGPFLRHVTYGTPKRYDRGVGLGPVTHTPYLFAHPVLNSRSPDQTSNTRVPL